MNDVINRKDAIGAILSVGHIAELSDGDAVIRVSAVNYVLRNLPTAQPEIIRCKDCKHRPTPTRADEGITYGFSVEFPDEKCPCRCEDGWYNWYPKNDFYCGYAERREE